jgi:hypothetical protein
MTKESFLIPRKNSNIDYSLLNLIRKKEKSDVENAAKEAHGKVKKLDSFYIFSERRKLQDRKILQINNEL